MTSKENRVYFEAVLDSKPKRSMFQKDIFLGSENIDEFTPPPGRAEQAARVLRSLNFRVHHVGTFSISGDGPRWLWERVFITRVKRVTESLGKMHPKIREMSYLSHKADTPFTIHKKLEGLVEKAYPQPPPVFFESPLPPPVGYHHLNVPDDIALILRAISVHKLCVTGNRVLVAMPDTGFYNHPFYPWHGYNYNRTLSPDAKCLDQDEIGHGTCQAANIFATAPNAEFIGIKMKFFGNATLAFKTASDLFPAVMSVSWGWDVFGNSVPNYLRPLEAAIIEAVQNRGITVCCAGGNYPSTNCFPAQMPDVIAVGGVNVSGDLNGDDFDLEASDYAISFDSAIYPGRHVPDVCGLVGMKPRGIYIVLPTEPNSVADIDFALAGGPQMIDKTAKDDGWLVTSGTSAAAPQVAGICTLLKEVQPSLSPALINTILRASARDVTKGQSATGQPAGTGHDGATGAGLVDAYGAYRLACSTHSSA